jgi:hypothetical protein
VRVVRQHRGLRALGLTARGEAALSEGFHLLGPRGRAPLAALLRRGALVPAFRRADHQPRVLDLTQKDSSVPMSLADAGLVRMTETIADAVLGTAATDFGIYRRQGRQAIPCRPPYGRPAR